MELYNSLGRKRQLFQPLHKNKVLIYVCGITPYDTTHLGHAFTYVFFDTLVRYLRYIGYAVIYTQNVTDVDDDIVKKAREVKQDWRQLALYWTNRFLTDMESLNVQKPTHYVKASDSIPTIIEIVQQLIAQDFAYVHNENVYLSIKRFDEYGKLSQLTRDQMLFLSKERGNNPDDPNKQDPLDFVLWQRSAQDEPLWDSPWGKGRPGWHIECSAMIYHYLGEQIDIHGGGRDLIYPHHDSEIAQMESFTNKSPHVNAWLHTAMVIYQGEKMSKSLGNLVMISQLLRKHSANAIRWLLLAHHYRKPWEYHQELLIKAQQHINLISKALHTGKKQVEADQLPEEIKQALDDDFNTPQALAIITKLAQTIVSTPLAATAKNCQSQLRLVVKILGFNIADLERFIEPR